MTKIVDVERRPLDVIRKERALRPPKDAEPVSAPAIIRANGVPVIAVGRIGGLDRLRRQLSGSLPWQGGTAGSQEARLSGFQPRFLAWGYSPPQPLRRRYGCAQCSLDREHPALADALVAATARAWSKACELLPAETDAHAQRVREAVTEDWLIGGLPFTSGVINDTAALPYHCDSGNLKHAWSVQIVVRRGVEGGWLHLPALDTWLECADGDVLFFPGQSELHGVTPVKRIARDARRFTIVSYAKSQMRKCWPIAEEHVRAARAATEANQRKASR